MRSLSLLFSCSAQRDSSSSNSSLSPLRASPTTPNRFWSQVLTQRSALELSADTYEIRGGQSAAKAAGAGRQ